MMSMVSGAVSQLRNVAGRAFASMIVALAALFIAAALPGAASAQTYSYSPSSQGDLANINGTGSYTSGSSPTLYYSSGDGGDQVTWVAFTIPNGAVYTSAGLTVSYTAYSGGAPSVQVRRVLSAVTSSAGSMSEIRTGTLYGSGSLTSGGQVTLALNATAVSDMNAIASGGGGTFRLGVSGPQSGNYFGEPSGITLAGNGGVATPSVSIAVSPASVSEDGATNLTYTVTRSASSTSALTVNLTTSGTATSGSDYTGAVSTVTIPANATTATVTIDPTVDGTVEANETVTLTVAAGSGYTVGAPSSATGTILNDDVPSATISVSPASVAEDGAPNLVYTVTLNQASLSAINVAYLVSGTATNGTDYATITSPLTIPAGNTTGTVTVNPTADATIESNETVTLTLTAGAGYTVGVPNAATGTILNDDLPNLAINDVTANEGNSGTTNFTFTVSLSAPAGPGGVTFDIGTANGSATAGSDFTASSLTSQTIPTGSSTYTFTVLVNGDQLNEPSETFFANITNVVNAIVVDGQGVGTIVNDDPLPSLTIGDVSINEGSSGAFTTVTATVTLSAASGQTISVNYATADGTATQPSDFTAVSGSLVFSPGQTSKTISIDLAADTVVETDETLFVNLSGATNATIADNQAVITILNDDVASPTVTAISPTSGSAGTSVVITGANLSGATDVTFGGTAATSVTVNSATQITATAPAGTGVVDVRVTTAGGTSAISAADQFTYNAALGLSLSFAPDPMIVGGASGTITMTFTNPNASASGSFNYSLMTDDVHTARIPGLGGTCVTSGYGTSVPSTAQVNFNSVEIPAGGCTITLPYRGISAGTAAFTTTAFTPSGYPQTASASTSITVLPAAPTVTALSPSSGPLSGGTAVTLTGTNFTGATAVSFGASPAASFSLDSATQITATAPAGSAGAVDVTVTTPSGTSATAGAGNDYTYVAAPAAPVTITPANGALTSDNTPTYTGTAGTGLTVNVIVDGTTIGTTTADGAGNWSYTPAVALADGAHTIRATATNAGGTSPNSNINTFTVDTTAPAAPVVTTPANGATINFSTPAYIGTAEPNTTVTIVVDGSAIGTTGANASGAWGFSQVTPLSPGSHTVRATATDAAGNTSPSSSTVTFSYVPITLPGGALAGGQVGTSYSASVTASGGTAPYTYAVTGGALPAGITLSTGGALSGTPTASGTYNFQVTATDSTSLTATGAYSITVNAPPAPDADPETATVTSTGGAQGIDLSGSVSGAASIQIVTPPAHGAASVSGFTVNYTPEPGYFGPVTFTYSAVGYPDGSTPGAVSAPATVTITIPDPVLALPGGALPGATVAATYSHAFSASGGTAPYTYAVTAGALPAGLTLSTGGVLSGTPTAGGPFSFSVTATDSSTGTGPFSVTGAYTLTVAAPTIVLSPATLPNATVAVAGYSQTITASGGVGGYSYALTAGALPAGMSLSTGGVLSGTPTAGGSFNFTVTATDQSTGAGPYTGSRAYTLTVDAAAIMVTPNTVPAATRGFAYSQAFSATGGVGSYTWAVSAGALPPGLTLSAAGTLSGTPTTTGTFNFTVRATDQATGSGPYSGTVSVTLVVNAAAITVTPTTLPSVMAGVAYDRSLSATGGAGTYTYAVTSGALPSGMTLSTAGRISGTSYAVGQANFTVTATDSFGNTGSVALRIVVTARPDPSQDPDVRGLDAAQAEATRRLASAQIDNFNQRLEQLHDGGGDQAMSMGLRLNAGVTDLAGVGQDADQRSRLGGGRMFDQQRADPDRAELNNRLWSSTDQAMTTGYGSPLGYGLNAGGKGAVSGGQPTLNAAPMQSDGSSSGGARFWTGGAITIGERDGANGQAGFSVRSTGVSLGVDFAVSPNFDLGFGGGFGEESADIGSADSSADSKQFSGVVYGSFRPQQGVFIDAMLGYGSLEFDLQRRVTADGSLVLGEREGTAMFGSIGLGYDRPVSIGRMTAYGRVESLDATLDAYAETGSALWALSYAERDVESLQGVLGARYVWSHEARDSVWTPSFRFEYRHEFADGGVQSLQYADWLSGPTYQIQSSGWDRSEINVGLGLNVTTADGWKVASELGARLATNQTAGTLRLTLSKSF